MTLTIDTAVEAQPESCRDSAKLVRELRRSADEVDAGSTVIGKTFSGATSSGATATALAGACTVISGAGKVLSDDLDEAFTALMKFASIVDDVKADMQAAIDIAAGGGLQVAPDRSIVLVDDATPAQVDTWNVCAARTNQARQSEYAASQVLLQVMSALAEHEAPVLPEPVLAPLVPVPQQDHGGGGSSGGGSDSSGSDSSGSTGSGSTSAGHHQVRAQLVPAGGGDHRQTRILREPDWDLQHDLAERVHGSRLQLADLQAQLAVTTDPAAQVQIQDDVDQTRLRVVELEAGLDGVRRENQEIKLENGVGVGTGEPRLVRTGPAGVPAPQPPAGASSTGLTW